MEFEKWHALGNDYVIVEHEALPWPLSAGRIRALCAPHTGIGSDGILLLGPPVPGSDAAAHLRIFNPDGSESGLSGNGAREAIMYLRARGRSHQNRITITTPAGPVRARIADERTCTMDIGTVRTASADFPEGPADGRAALETVGRTWQIQHVAVGNPQCVIAIDGVEALAALELGAIGSAIEHHPAFPNRTNVSWYTELGPGSIRARIFERGVGETSASGTGATGAAVAYVLAGGASPVTVGLDGGELTVEVGGDLRVHLTGWAIPVYAGRLSEPFVKELHATE